MKRWYPFDLDLVTEPGKHLLETLHKLSVSPHEFAHRNGYSPGHIHRLLSGQARIRPHTARRLALGTGIPASLWINLEANYQSRKRYLAKR